MARKRYSEEDILKLLREIEVHILGGTDGVSACRKAGVIAAVERNSAAWGGLSSAS